MQHMVAWNGQKRTGMRQVPRVVAAVLWLVFAGGCQGPGTHPLRVFWGDLHGHTALSDGKGTPEDYFRHARYEAHLDFVAVTDHDFGHGPPWRLAETDWQHIQDVADAATGDGTFVAFAGWEWTSQPKYWTGHAGGEGLFVGEPRNFNHKIVLLAARTPGVFSAKDAATCTPDLLAAAVGRVGGVIHNAHPASGQDGRDQWAYSTANEDLFANSEIGPDTVRWQGKSYAPKMESTVFAFLQAGRRTGFVGVTDTHEGKPAARTAVRARALTRRDVLEALWHRRCWAVTNARIVLDIDVDGHGMGEEVETASNPVILVRVEGTSGLEEVALIRNGRVIRHERSPATHLAFTHVDRKHTAQACDWYVVRVTQTDVDQQGNPSRAWSSPIWVRRRR